MVFTHMDVSQIRLPKQAVTSTSLFDFVNFTCLYSASSYKVLIFCRFSSLCFALLILLLWISILLKKRCQYSTERSSAINSGWHDLYKQLSLDKREALLLQCRTKSVKSSSHCLLNNRSSASRIDEKISHSKAVHLPAQTTLTIQEPSPTVIIREPSAHTEKVNASHTNSPRVVPGKGKNMIAPFCNFEYSCKAEILLMVEVGICCEQRGGFFGLHHSLYIISLQDMLRPDFDWKILFEPFRYYRIYGLFVKIFFSACDKDELRDWVDWLRSHFCCLLIGICVCRPVVFCFKVLISLLL